MSDIGGRRLLTLFGWAPGVRAMLAGSVLACGCSVGAYERWDGSAVQVVERQSDTCKDPAHKPGLLLPRRGT